MLCVILFGLTLLPEAWYHAPLLYNLWLLQENTEESREFRKIQWSQGFSGKYSGVMGFQESTVESRGFRKVQWSHGVSEKYSGVTGFRKV